MHWFTQLDEVAPTRSRQHSFHVFAESRHADARGQIFNLGADERLVIEGTVEATAGGSTLSMRRFSQLVVAPGTPCDLLATHASAIELVTFLSSATDV